MQVVQGAQTDACHQAVPKGAAGTGKSDWLALSFGGCLLERLVLSWIRRQRVVYHLGCMHGVSVVVSQNVDLSVMQFAWYRCLVLAWQLPETYLTPIAQRYCLHGHRPSSMAVCGLGPGSLDPAPFPCGLNSRQINHLQRNTGETHYRGSFRQSKPPGTAIPGPARCFPRAK